MAFACNGDAVGGSEDEECGEGRDWGGKRVLGTMENMRVEKGRRGGGDQRWFVIRLLKVLQGACRPSVVL